MWDQNILHLLVQVMFNKCSAGLVVQETNTIKDHVIPKQTQQTWLCHKLFNVIHLNLRTLTRFPRNCLQTCALALCMA